MTVRFVDINSINWVLALKPLFQLYTAYIIVRDCVCRLETTCEVKKTEGVSYTHEFKQNAPTRLAAEYRISLCVHRSFNLLRMSLR